MDGASDPSVLGGNGGSGGSDATAGSDAAGSFSSSGSSSGGTDTAGSSSFGGQTIGGQLTGGTFNTAGTTSGSGGAGGATAGGGAGGAGGAGGKAGAGGTGGKAGAGGTGGMAPTGACAEDPVTAKNTWTASANFEVTSECANDPNSAYCSPVEQGIDGNPSTRFSTGRARAGDEWYQIDFGDTVAVSRVVLSTAAGSGDYTLGYEIRMADTEGAIAGSAVIVSGDGMQGTTTINFPSVKTGRFLRINQTEAMSGWWSLTEVDVSCQ